MAIETVGRLAITATGEHIHTPPHADPITFADFARQVAIVPGGCHLWLGDTLSDYGIVDDALTGAHRYAWSAWHGPIPDGADILHACDEPLCAPLTPDVLAGHLHAGDALANAAERAGRGRQGSTRHGLRQHGADTRPRQERSLELQRAIIAANRRGRPLADAVERHRLAGSPRFGQYALPITVPEQPARPLRLVPELGRPAPARRPAGSPRYGQCELPLAIPGQRRHLRLVTVVAS